MEEVYYKFNRDKVYPAEFGSRSFTENCFTKYSSQRDEKCLHGKEKLLSRKCISCLDHTRAIKQYKDFLNTVEENYSQEEILYELDRDWNRKHFLNEYFLFMKNRGTVVNKLPVVAKVPLDLFRLYHVVQSLGGFSQVVKKRRWSRVVRELSLPSSITSAAFTLRTQYQRLLYPYECEKKGITNNYFYPECENTSWDRDQEEIILSRTLNQEKTSSSKHNHLRVKTSLSNSDGKVYFQTNGTYSLSEDNLCMQTKQQSDDHLLWRAFRRSRSEENLPTDLIRVEAPHFRVCSNENLLHTDKSLFGDEREGKYNSEEVETKQYVDQNNKLWINDPTTIPTKADEQYYEPSKTRSLNKNLDNHMHIFDPNTQSYSASYQLSNQTFTQYDHSKSPGFVKNLVYNSRRTGHRLTNSQVDSGRQSSHSNIYKECYSLQRATDHLHSGLHHPEVKSPRLSTNVAEIEITVEKRTEKAMTVSVTVNGLCYSEVKGKMFCDENKTTTSSRKARSKEEITRKIVQRKLRSVNPKTRQTITSLSTIQIKDYSPNARKVSNNSRSRKSVKVLSNVNTKYHLDINTTEDINRKNVTVFTRRSKRIRRQAKRDSAL